MKLKIIYDESEFLDQVMPVLPGDCPDISIQPFFMDGGFAPSDLPRLIEFCRTNTKFHIMSQVALGLFYNFTSNSGTVYFLCYGNSDPNLICVDVEFLKRRLNSDTFELMQYYRAAELVELKERRKAMHQN